MKVLLGALLALLIVGTASADTLWTYSGNSTSGPETAGNGVAVNPCACALSGSVALNDAGVATAWSFTDGIVTLTNFNSTGVIHPHDEFDEMPLFFTWYVAIAGEGTDFLSEYYGSAHEATDSGGSGLYVQGNRGLWTEVAATPEPSTFLLVGLGLAICCLPLRGARKI